MECLDWGCQTHIYGNRNISTKYIDYSISTNFETSMLTNICEYSQRVLIYFFFKNIFFGKKIIFGEISNSFINNILVLELARCYNNYFLALLYLILLYMKKWAFNIKIESGTTIRKWSRRWKEISKGKVKNI